MAAEPRSIDRRTFSLGMLVALAACNRSEKSEAAMTYGASSRFPSSSPTAMTTASFWTQWRDRFVSPEGRVVDTGNGDISHSEGQSYGLLLALQADDRATFARIASWTEANLARSDMALYAWRWDPQTRGVTDANNATDGDIVIAWALSLAAQRWAEPQWGERSATVRAAIRQHCVVSRFGRQLLLPGVAGFVESDKVVLNPSYFVWPALDHFARIDGMAAWNPVISDGEDLLRLARFGAHKLPSDWIVVSGEKAVAPAPDKPPRFGYDAIRVALWGAQGNRSAITAPIASWWRSCLAQHRPIPAWVDVVTGEEANYALSNGGAAIAGRLLGTASPTQLSEDYFAASQQLLAQS
ncbi:glycosyl hydrolase family 8 [Novosphingobium sp. 1949]|uniref:cellulase n=1 Tax=Novosphingobium organovorum TaxID=2930092 RepID=A0ABT0BIN6_9SPHN|nr:glycosyl hydrolase family 8 [Novosphingobium organovorum]MCJ2184912.1 glycosyl hydrolase family 8 [Novosphingobium organovorum]